jgi:hypothetical protein
VSCDETSTIGVPGTTDVAIEFVLNPCPSTATPAQCATFIAVGSATPPDQEPGNNTSYAGLLVANGAAVIFGLNADPTPTSTFKHTTSVLLTGGSGGSVNIYQSPTCPPDHTNCFIGTVTISTSATGPKTRTLEFLASLTGSPARPLSQVTIFYEAAGATQFSALTSCSKNNPPTSENACVQDSYKFTSPDGVVYVFVIQGGKDDSFTAD